METKVLVTYASKYGATAEIAEKIGQTLQQEGLPVDVLPVKKIGNLSDYKAIVIGSAIYIGMWRKEAANFLKKNEKLLTERPVWIFSTGPTGKGDAVELLKGWRVPKGLQPVIDRIKPRDIAIFHGNVDAKKMNFIEKWMINIVKSPVGDFRDWNTITRWSADIAGTLKKQG